MEVEDWSDSRHTEEVHVLVSEQSSQTTTPAPTATVVDQSCGPITAQAAIHARDSILGLRQEVAVSSFLGFLLGPIATTPIATPVSSVDASSIIISSADVAATPLATAESISQLSQEFQASVQAIQSSAASAISQANVIVQQGLNASPSSKEVY